MVLIHPGELRNDSCAGPRRGENYVLYVSQKSNSEKSLGVLGIYAWIAVRSKVFVALNMNISVV